MPPATWSRSRTATAATTSCRVASRIRWTRGGEKTIESIKTARASRAVRDHDHAEEIKTKLEAQPVTVKVRAGEGGRLFGAVTAAEIAERARRGLGRAGRQAHDRGRQPDQGARLARGRRQAPRRGVGHRGPQRRSRPDADAPRTTPTGPVASPEERALSLRVPGRTDQCARIASTRTIWLRSSCLTRIRILPLTSGSYLPRTL